MMRFLSRTNGAALPAAVRAGRWSILVGMLVVHGGGALAQTRIFESDGAGLDWRGSRVVDAGDVNGDGVHDFAVSSIRYDNYRGRVDVYSGADLSLLWFNPGGAQNDRFGWALAPAGDLNGDGYDDLIISALWENAGTGVVRVLSGRHVVNPLVSPYLVAWTGTIRSGLSVLCPGDLDGDGTRDIVYGSEFYSNGSVTARSGSTGVILWAVPAFYNGSLLGASLAGLDDLDGDGVPEVAVGAPGEDTGGTDSGAVRVLSGATGNLLQVFDGQVALGQLGLVIASGADLDGDGLNELAVAAPYYTGPTGLTQQGEVFVISFRQGLSSPSLVGGFLFGAEAGARLGSGLSLSGDLDGDGARDLVVGARRGFGTGSEEGVAWLYSGAELASGADPRVVATEPGGSLEDGAEVSALHDVTADGVDELVIGLPTSDHAGFDHGRVAVWSGASTAAGFSFCNGLDGVLAACPCANPGNPDSGCDTAQGAGGIALSVVEQVTFPQNRATLSGSGYSTGVPTSAVVIRSDTVATTPVVFGDGLRCVGVPLVRLAPTTAVSGTSTHTIGHGAMSGSGTFYYQIWFRNQPASFCTPDAFNLSNAWAMSW
jgi:FG-GAP repeat